MVPERLKMLGAGSREEGRREEDEMVDLVHNFGARKRKRGASFKRTTGTTPEWSVRLVSNHLARVQMCR